MEIIGASDGDLRLVPEPGNTLRAQGWTGQPFETQEIALRGVNEFTDGEHTLNTFSTRDPHDHGRYILHYGPEELGVRGVALANGDTEPRDVISFKEVETSGQEGDSHGLSALQP